MRKLLIFIFMFFVFFVCAGGYAHNVHYWVYQLQRQDADARVRAEKHLIKMGEKAVDAVLGCIDNDGWLIRCAVLRILSHSEQQEAIKAVLYRLKDKHEVVRKVARESLMKITGKDFVVDDFENWKKYLEEVGLISK